jgi:hypothetical protein
MCGPRGTQAVVPPDDLAGSTAGTLQQDLAVRLVVLSLDKVVPDAAGDTILSGADVGFVPHATVEGMGRLERPRD